jgi:hypothetical protein
MAVTQTHSSAQPITVRGDVQKSYHWCSHQELTPGRWVSLIKLPSPMGDDEALLLCEEGRDRWHVWIPNHGEAIIGTDSFAC